MPKIKICGITTLDDIEIVNKFDVEFVGFVVFFPKSKRNIELDHVSQLMKHLNKRIKTVAVTVSPTKEQIERIQEVGFHYIQIHGSLNRDIEESCKLPIFRAFHISADGMEYNELGKKGIIGYVLDGEKPGNGQAFDWNLMKNFNRADKLLMLAGGLCETNVAEGIKQLNPDIVDVSSGVENEDGKGKSLEKVEAFVKTVRGFKR